MPSPTSELRIVLAAGIFPPDIGGPATYTDHIAVSLTRLGHRVSVVCYADVSRRETYNGYTVVRISRKHHKLRTLVAYGFALWKQSLGAQLIYAQGPTAGGMQARLVSRLRGIPYVVKVTGDYAWEQGCARFGITMSIDDFQKENSLPVAVRRLRNVQQRVVRHAAVVVVPSGYLGTMVSGWGVPTERIRIVYNAVEPVRMVHASKDDAKAAHGVAGKQVVLSAGRLVPWKGFATLIRVWPKVAAMCPDAVLMIAGGGPDEVLLRRQIQEQGLTESVRLLGKQPLAAMLGLYEAADIFVLNTGYEGLSHMLLEAMAYGLPCAVSNRGGNPEVLQNGQSGELFEYDNEAEIVLTITKLLRNQDLQNQYHHAALQQVRKFSYERMLADTLTVLSQVATKGK